MADESKPVPPAPETPAQPPAQQAAPAKPATYIPIGQTFEAEKKSLPVVPAIVVLVVLGIVVAVLAFVFRPKPVAGGNITKVIAVDQGGSVIVAVHVKFNNVSSKTLFLRDIDSELEAADGKKYADIAASVADHPRYFQAFPQLAEDKIDPLAREQKLAPGESRAGMVIFSYPVDKAGFDGRKSLSVKLEFYNAPAILLKQ
jgi:hypothetical protein